jgi:hypothetical protein
VATVNPRAGNRRSICRRVGETTGAVTATALGAIEAARLTGTSLDPEPRIHHTGYRLVLRASPLRHGIAAGCRR